MNIDVPSQLNTGASSHSHLVEPSDRFDSRQCVTLKVSSDFHKSRITSAVGDIASTSQSSDISLFSSCGSSIPANRILLALASPFLANLIKDVPSCSEPVLVLPDCSSETLTHIVRIITTGFTTSHFGSSLEHIFNEIDEIMEIAKDLDIAIVDLSYEDANTVLNDHQNYVEEDEESSENEVMMEEEDSYETMDTELSVEYEFVRVFEDNAINLCNVKCEAFDADSLTASIGSFGTDETFVNEYHILESVQTVQDNLTIPKDEPKDEEPKKEKGFYCKKCPLSFSNFDDLEVHIKTHIEEKPFQCTICPKRFNCEQRKDKHMKKHETGFEVDAPIFTCDVCDKMFYKKSHLRYHIMAHTDIKEHKCPFCPDDFYSYESKRSHIRKKHAVDEGFLVKCKICQKTFYDKEILEKHFAQHGFAAEHVNKEPSLKEL